MSTFEYEGQIFTLRQLSLHFGIKYKALWDRLNRGMDITDAMKECVNDPNTWIGIKAKNR